VPRKKTRRGRDPPQTRSPCPCRVRTRRALATGYGRRLLRRWDSTRELSVNSLNGSETRVITSHINDASRPITSHVESRHELTAVTVEVFV
jgi:hypothetical protein